MKRFLCSIVLLAVLLTACAPAASQTKQSPVSSAPLLPTDLPPATSAPAASELRSLTVMTHDSFASSEGVIREFEQANNVKITFLKSGDAGAALNKAILSKDAPLADVFYGVDNTFLSRAIDAGIFESYASPMIEHIPDEFNLDLKNRALPVDYGDVCLNYSKAFFAKNSLAVPATLDDLLRPEYNGQLVVENPATSSPGLAFLLVNRRQFPVGALVGHFPGNYGFQNLPGPVVILGVQRQIGFGHIVTLRNPFSRLIKSGPLASSSFQ